MNLATITAQIGEAHVIRENDEDVRFLGWLASEAPLSRHVQGHETEQEQPTGSPSYEIHGEQPFLPDSESNNVRVAAITLRRRHTSDYLAKQYIDLRDTLAKRYFLPVCTDNARIAQLAFAHLKECVAFSPMSTPPRSSIDLDAARIGYRIARF